MKLFFINKIKLTCLSHKLSYNQTLSYLILSYLISWLYFYYFLSVYKKCKSKLEIFF